jgi:hypothetical protein
MARGLRAAASLAMTAPPERCPECGAPRVAGLGCWQQLGVLLAWEQDDPALQREHFLTVASYNLQHPARFTDDAISGLRQALADHLDRGVPVAEIRRRASAATDGRTRVHREEPPLRPVLREWPMTIADVYLPDAPEGVAERVRAWARTISREG